MSLILYSTSSHIVPGRNIDKIGITVECIYAEQDEVGYNNRASVVTFLPERQKVRNLMTIATAEADTLPYLDLCSRKNGSDENGTNEN